MHQGMVAAFAAERTGQKDVSRAALDSDGNRDGPVRLVLGDGIGLTLDIRPGGDKIGRCRIEIADPEFRREAKPRRMPHAAIRRHDARTGDIGPKPRRRRKHAPEKDDEGLVCASRLGHG